MFPVTVMPSWGTAVVYLLPLTWALNGMRDALILGQDPASLCGVFFAMFFFDVVTIVLGLLVFHMPYNYAKKQGDTFRVLKSGTLLQIKRLDPEMKDQRKR